MQIDKQDKYTTYSRKELYGKDDLRSKYPYNYTEWDTTFNPHFDWTEEQYINNKSEYEKLIDNWNNNYINHLKKENKYLTEYTQTITFMNNPMFDSLKSKSAVNSYKFVLLDFSTNEK